jgi:hypothetical protein
MGRAERRHHEDRIKDRVRSMIRDSWVEGNLCENSRFVGRMSATRKPCSCYLCGNFRRFRGPTKSEKLGDVRSEVIA